MLNYTHFTELCGGKSRGNFDFYATDDDGQLWQVSYRRKSARRPEGVNVYRAKREGDFISLIFTIGGGDVRPDVHKQLIEYARDQLRAKERA